MHTFNRSITVSAIAFAAADNSAPANAPAPIGTDAAKQAPRSNVAAPASKPAKRAAKPGNKRGKPVNANAATEAKPDPRVARAERIAADRSAVAALYRAFEANRASIPVKPLSAFKPVATTAHSVMRNPSVRQAAAIAVAFSAAGVKLADGASAPRVFDLDGKRVCVENGVLRDAVSSGLIRVSGASPETEKLTIANGKRAAILGLIGERIAKAGKLI